ncbi:MAG: hypothetical protein RBT62_11385 [Spirochaetia bacterium]|jgi:hypothetical protein|nr:hypothetical protein [Spirochaetia bacterium]
MSGLQTRACTIFKGLRVLALASILALPVSALDLESEAFFGNLGLPWAGETAMTASIYPANLWIYGGRVSVSDNLGSGFSLLAEYETDVILRNIVRGVITYNTGFASISAGPMVGAFNTSATPLKAGIDIGFKVEAPGLVFLSARAASSMGAGMVALGDYSQELSELSAGWYVYNAICSVSMTNKRYYRILASGDPLVDNSSDYRFSVDVHKKGAPYQVLTELGYRSLTRRYPDSLIDGLSALVFGAKINAYAGQQLDIFAGLESGVYVYGIEQLAGRGPASNTFIFNASVGIRLHLDKPTMDSTPPAEPETFEPETPEAVLEEGIE